MADVIMDACALIAFLRDEDGADIIEQMFNDADISCSAHAINLCEVYYDFLRVADYKTAVGAIKDLIGFGLVIREDMDSGLWRAAGDLKSKYRLSLADCFAVALTSRIDGELVTSDHHEFDSTASNWPPSAIGARSRSGCCCRRDDA